VGSSAQLIQGILTTLLGTLLLLDGLEYKKLLSKYPKEFKEAVVKIAMEINAKENDQMERKRFQHISTVFINDFQRRMSIVRLPSTLTDPIVKVPLQVIYCLINIT
jgi:hypothetical protein